VFGLVVALLVDQEWVALLQSLVRSAQSECFPEVLAVIVGQWKRRVQGKVQWVDFVVDELDGIVLFAPLSFCFCRCFGCCCLLFWLSLFVVLVVAVCCFGCCYWLFWMSLLVVLDVATGCFGCRYWLF